MTPAEFPDRSSSVTCLTQEQKRSLYRDGYVILKNAIAPELVEKARARIRTAKKGENLGTAKEMTDLVNASSVSRNQVREGGVIFEPVLTPDLVVNQEILFEQGPTMVSLRGRYQDRAWVDFANSIELPSFSVVDGTFSYFWRDLRFDLHGLNLLDRRVAEDPDDCMPYLLSKKALAAFTRSAARALGPSIRVNGVAPGGVLPAVEDGCPDAAPMAFDPRASAADVARAVVALAESDGVTGHVSYVGGSPT